MDFRNFESCALAGEFTGRNYFKTLSNYGLIVRTKKQSSKRGFLYFENAGLMSTAVIAEFSQKLVIPENVSS